MSTEPTQTAQSLTEAIAAVPMPVWAALIGAAVLAALTFACDKAVQLLQSDEERTVLRGIHALAQAASQYARVYEVAELSERVEHLEKELGMAEGYVAGPN